MAATTPEFRLRALALALLVPLAVAWGIQLSRGECLPLPGGRELCGRSAWSGFALLAGASAVLALGMLSGLANRGRRD